MSTKHFDERITTRYGKADESIYHEVITLVKSNNIPKSTAQLLLVKRGLKHTNNPEPLVKEKIVYRDRPGKTVEKVVYKDKIVYRDREGIPTEHVGIQEPIKADLQNTRLRASADKLTTSDKADPPSSSIALKKKKSAKESNGISGWGIAGGAGLIGLLIYLIVR